MALSTALGSHLSELNAVIAMLTRGLRVPEVGSGLDIRTGLHFRSGLTTQLALFRENLTYSLHMMSDCPYGLTLEDDFIGASHRNMPSISHRKMFDVSIVRARVRMLSAQFGLPRLNFLSMR